MTLQPEVSKVQTTLPTWVYKAVLEQLHEGVVISAMDGSFRRINDAAAVLYGYDDPRDFAHQLPKLSSIFELRTYPAGKPLSYNEWPVSRLRHGARQVSATLYVKRRDKKHEVVLHYTGKIIKNPDGSDAFAILNLHDLTEQVRDRQALQMEQARLKQAQKAAKVGTFEWQIPIDKNIWSEEMEALYGLKTGSFDGTFETWKRTIHPEDVERIYKIVQAAFRSHQRHFETEWRATLPDKSIRHIYAKAEIYYDTENRPLRMIGINMDITQRRSAASAYKSSVDRQSAFFKTALDAIITTDQTGTITEFNPAAERIFGYSRAEALGKEMAVLIIPSDYISDHRKGLAKYLETGSGRIMDKLIEVTAKRKNGQEFPVDLFITRIGTMNPPVFMGTLRDITERKHSEQALRESEQRFRFMAESMPQKIYTATPDGTTDYVNPQWMRYTGMTLDRLKKSGWAGYVHPDDVEKTTWQWQHSIATGDLYQIEHRFRRVDGEFRWHLTRAHAMHDEAGAIIKWIGSNTDIEDLKHSQELEEKTTLLTEQREQLLMINHAKDEFISLASHQLRTPATGVKQYVGMLMQGYFGELTTEQMAMVRSAYESNERQLSIINALLNVARLDAGKVTLKPLPCDMSQLLADIIQEQFEAFRMRKQNLTLQKPPQPVICEVDSQLIRMVLENIVDNAGKYSRHGHPVEVRLRQTKTNRTTIIEIQDHGVGMRQKDQAKLFQKFSRIDNDLSTQASGSGLGLYWAKKIMDLHGGSITVESRARQGSTFTITLPQHRV